MCNYLSFIIISLFIFTASPFCAAQAEKTPFDFLRERERQLRTSKGEVYIGKVMILDYDHSGVDVPQKFHPLLLELTDLLKSPLRENYRVVIKGFRATGSKGIDRGLWPRRAVALRKLFVETFYMKKERIIAEVKGASAHMASNEKAKGPRHGRGLEIHLYGNVAEAARYIDKQEESR